MKQIKFSTIPCFRNLFLYIFIVFYIILNYSTFSYATQALDLNNKAIEFFKNGQIERALDTMYRAVELDPQNVEINFNLALLLYKTGYKYVEAKKACEKVLTIDKNHAKAKALLKACINQILQSEGVKYDTSLADSEFLETKREVTSKVSDVPTELLQFLKLLYLEKNFDEAYIYFTSGAKKAILASDFSNYMSKQLSSENLGIPCDVKINSIRTKEKEGYGVVLFDVIFEKTLKQPMKTAFGGYDTVLEKHKKFMFFVKEEDSVKVIPPDFMVDKFIDLCAKYPDVLTYNGREIKLENEWQDSIMIEYEKMSDFLLNKKPDEALKLRIMLSAFTFLKARREKNYNLMYEQMAALQYKYVGNKMKFIKQMTQKDLRCIIRDIKILDVNVKAKIACVKYELEMFNHVGTPKLSVNRLISYLMVIKEGVEWKVCDLWRTKWFVEKFPMVYKEFNPGEDQFHEFNGRDWIDRSIEYNAWLREELQAIENR